MKTRHAQKPGSPKKVVAAPRAAVKAQPVKVGVEIAALHRTVNSLMTAVANQPKVTEELQAAVHAVRAASASLDQRSG